MQSECTSRFHLIEGCQCVTRHTLPLLLDNSYSCCCCCCCGWSCCEWLTFGITYRSEMGSSACHFLARCFTTHSLSYSGPNDCLCATATLSLFLCVCVLCGHTYLIFHMSAMISKVSFCFHCPFACSLSASLRITLNPKWSCWWRRIVLVLPPAIRPRWLYSCLFVTAWPNASPADCCLPSVSCYRSCVFHFVFASSAWLARHVDCNLYGIQTSQSLSRLVNLLTVSGEGQLLLGMS